MRAEPDRGVRGPGPAPGQAGQARGSNPASRRSRHNGLTDCSVPSRGWGNADPGGLTCSAQYRGPRLPVGSKEHSPAYLLRNKTGHCLINYRIADQLAAPLAALVAHAGAQAAARPPDRASWRCAPRNAGTARSRARSPGPASWPRASPEECCRGTLSRGHHDPRPRAAGGARLACARRRAAG